MASVGVPLQIDGAHGEGGASLIRTALAMATLTQQPTRIVNIRSDARHMGLRSEDLAILKGFSLSCGAEVIGAEVGERSLSFLPTRAPIGLNENIDVPDDEDGPGHANALVVAGSLMAILARTGVYSTLNCCGETYGNNVLTYDYFANVTLSAFRRMGLYAYTNMDSAGYGRGSRGEVALEIEPSHLDGIKWADRGKLVAVRAIVSTSELPDAVAERGISHLSRLGYYANITIDVEATRVKSRGPGAFATIWAEFERGFGGATTMGSRGVRMESIVQTAFEAFHSWYKTDATVDPYLADQLLIPAILAEGETTFKVSKLTERFLTVVWVIKQFLPIHITIKGQEGEPGVVTITR